MWREAFHPGASCFPAWSFTPRFQVLSTDHLDVGGSIDGPGSGPKCQVTLNLITNIIPKRKPGPDSLMVTFEVFLRPVVTSGSIVGEWHVAGWVQAFLYLALF